jgi:predicted PurR-regulated permease PerM
MNMPRTTAALKALRSDSRAKRTVGLRNRDIVRTTAMVLGVWLLLKLFWLTNALFFAVFLGMLFGIAVSGGTDRLQRYKIPRGVGAPLIVLGFLGVLVGFGAWIAPTLREQGTELRRKLPEAADRVQDWVRDHQGGLVGLIVSGGEDIQQVTSPPVTPQRQAGQQPADTTAAVHAPSIQNQLREKMSGLSRYLFPFITSAVEIVGGILLIVFLSIYFAVEPEVYRRGLLSLLPARRRARGALMMDRVAEVLRKWLVTQLIAMVVMGVLSTIMLLALRVKAALALGVLCGLFEFIPTVGPILSALPGVAMGFLDSPEKAMWVAFAYWALQFVENHLLIPILMKEGLRLPPALTVIAQALLALVFGFIGLMVAVPFLAVLMVIFQMFYLEQLPKEGTWTYPVFTGDEGETERTARG